MLSTRGRATKRQFVVIHPPAAVPRVQRRVWCKAQVLQGARGTRSQGCLAEASVAPKAMALAWAPPWEPPLAWLAGHRLANPGRWANADLKAKDKALVPRLRRPLDLSAVRFEESPVRVLSLLAGPREAARARAGRPKAFHFCCRADTKKICPGRVEEIHQGRLFSARLWKVLSGCPFRRQGRRLIRGKGGFWQRR